MKKTITIDGMKVQVNDQAHVRNNVSEASLADYGWTEEFWENMLYVADNMPRHEWMKDPQILNNLGIVFTEGVGVDIDMERGIKYYERAVMMDDDLARFNLAEIFSSGMNGVEVNYKRAYKLYRACGLPYAHYRLGEYFEYGMGVGIDEAMSQKYYRLASEEGYEPARLKVKG